MSRCHAEEMRALRLIREALAQGYAVSLSYEDDPVPEIKDSTDYEELKGEIHACDMMSVSIRRFGPNGKPIPSDGATFLLIYGNGEDGPIADHTDNAVGRRFYSIAMGSTVD